MTLYYLEATPTINTNLLPNTLDYIALSTSSTSTDQSIYNGFTAGEILADFFLFVIASVVVYQFFYFTLKGVKVK